MNRLHRDEGPPTVHYEAFNTDPRAPKPSPSKRDLIPVFELGIFARALRRIFCGGLAVGALASFVAAAPTYAYPSPFNPSLVTGGPVYGADPSFDLIQDPTVYLYATCNQAFVSTDTGGTYANAAIAEAPQTWWSTYSAPTDSCRPWGPDVSYHGASNKYWMYYSVTTWGSQHSAIGVATSSSGAPGTWVDSGSPVVSSNWGDSFNAIDGHDFQDSASGQNWLSFGSIYQWGTSTGSVASIYIAPVDQSTGQLTGPAPGTLIAHNNNYIIESPHVVDQWINGTHYYYLFFSHGNCCSGTDLTWPYEVMVGRATSPTGPYLDESGVDLRNGGGTPVLQSHDYVYNPGAADIYWDPHWQHLEMGYSYYDGRFSSSQRVVGIDNLYFDGNGWPYL